MIQSEQSDTAKGEDTEEEMDDEYRVRKSRPVPGGGEEDQGRGIKKDHLC